MPNGDKYSVAEFATIVRDKYNAYQDITDDVLVNKYLEKYPVYQDRIDFGEKQPEAQVEEDLVPDPVQEQVVVGEAEEKVAKDPIIETRQKILDIKNSEEYISKVSELEEEVDQPKTRLDVTRMTGSLDSMTPQYKEVEYFVYDDLEDEARAKVAEIKNINSNEVSPEDWRVEAKKMWVDNQSKKIFEEQQEEILESFEDQYGSKNIIQDGLNLISPFVSNSGPVGKLGAIILDEFSNENQYNKAIKDLKISFEDIEAEKQKEVKKDNDLMVFHVQDYQKMSNELETILSKPKEQITQEDIDRGRQIERSMDITKQAYDDALESYSTKISEMEDISSMVDMAGRTYNNIDVAQNRISSTVLNLVGGLTTLSNELTTKNIIEKTTGIDITSEESKDMLPEFLRFVPDFLKIKDDVEKNIYTELFKESRKINEATKKRQDLSGINTLEEFGEFTLDLFSEQAVNTAVTASTGGAGLMLISASASGQKMNEMNIEMEGVKDAEGMFIVPPKKISPLQYYSSGFLYGAAEYVTEKVALSNFNIMKRTFSKASRLKGTDLSNQYYSYKDAFKNWGVNMNKEGAAEFAAQLSNNFTDKIILGKDISMTEGLDQAYVSGAIMSGLGFNAPVLVNDIYKAYNTDANFKKAQQNSEKIFNNTNQISRLQKLRSEKEGDVKALEDIDFAIKTYRNESDNLIKENFRQKRDTELLISTLDESPRKKQDLIDINNNVYKIKSEIDKIAVNESIDNKTKQDKISQLQTEISEQNSIKERIISEVSKETIIYESKKADNIIKEISKTVKDGSELNVVKVKDIKDAIVKANEAIDKAKISDKVLNEEMKSRNLSKEETEIQLKKELSDGIIKDLKQAEQKNENVHGFYTGANFGMPLVFVSESNSIDPKKGGNISVYSHEVGHASIFKKLLEKDADIIGLVEELESYIKKRYNKAYKKFKEVEVEYKDETAEGLAEEKLAGLTDFMRQNNIKSDLTLRGKLLNKFKKVKDNTGELSEIKTGEDVFNLLTSFTSSFETGKLQGLTKELLEDRVDIKAKEPIVKAVEKKPEVKKPKAKKQTAAEKMLAKAEAVKKGDVVAKEDEVEDIKITRTTIKDGIKDTKGRTIKVVGKAGSYKLRRVDGKTVEVLGEFKTLDAAKSRVAELVGVEAPVKKPVAKKPKAKKAAKIEKPEALKPLDKKETNAARGRYLNDFIGQSKDWLIDNIDIKNTDEWKKVDQDKKKATKEFIKGKNQSKFSKSSFNKQELDQISEISKEWINEEKNNSTISRGLIGKLTEDVADLEQQELNDRLKLIDKVAGSVSNIKFSKSKDVGPQINKLYDEMTSMWNDGGSDFTFQEIYKNKLLDELIGRRIDSFVLKGKPPGWTNESRADLINQTYLEFLPHIRNFNKAFHNYEKGAVENDNLFAWINSFMNEKVGNSFKKIGLKPEFDVDVTEAKAVTYEETEAQTEEREERDFSIRKKLGLNDDFKTKVFDKVKGVMRGRIPAVNSPEFKSKLEKEFERELFNTIREDVFGFEWKKRGAREVMPFNETKYDKFIRDNFLAMYEKLPLSTLSKMRSLKSGESLVKEVIDPKTGKQRRMTIQEAAMSGAKDVKAGNPIFEKFTPQELTDGEIFTEYFINPKIGRKSMRMEGLAKILAKEIAFDAVMEVVSDPTVFERMKDIYEIQDIELFGNELEVIGKQIDRNPNLKFSKSGTKLLNDQVFRNKFLNNLDYIKEKITYKKIKNQIEQGTPVSVVFKDIFKQEYKDKNKVVDLDNFAKDLQDLINKYIEVYNNRKGMAISLPEIISLKIDESLVELSVKNLTGLDISFAELFSDQNRLIDVKQTLVDIFSEMNPQDVVDLIYNIKRGIFKDINNFNLIINAEDFNDNFLVASHVKFLTKKQLDEKGKSTGHWIENKDGSITEIKPSVVSKDGKNGNWLITTKSDKSIIESFERQKENAKKTQEVLLKFLDKLKKQDIDKKSKAMVSYWLRWAGGMNSIVRMSFEPYSIQNQVLENRKTYKDKVSKNAKDKFLKNNRVVVEHRSPANDLSLLINEYLFTKDKNQNDLKSFLKDKAKVNYIVKSLDNSLNKFYKAKTTITNVKGVDPNLSSYYTIPVLLDYSRNTKNKSLSFTVIVKGKQKELSRIDLVDYKPSSNVAKEYKKVKSDNKFSLSKSKVVKPSASMTNQDVLSLAATIDAALENARNSNLPVKKIRVFDFDDTLAQTKSNVLYTMPDGTTGKLTAEEFAKKGDDMAAEGAVWDFSEFNKVMEGRKGPLFKVAEAIQKARGTEDVFILTARAAEAAPAIKEFLDSLGLNIPLENITGLGDSSPFAKSQWVVEKAAEGYNDFYFADDAYKNVRAVQDALSVIDVTSKVQQAKIKFSLNTKRDLKWKTIGGSFNIVEADFEVDGKDYQIEIKKKGVGHIFSKLEEHFSTLGLSLSPTKEIADDNLREKELSGGKPKILDASFYRITDNFYTGIEKDIELTGEGNAAEVISIVVNGLVDKYKKTKGAQGVTITAYEPSRARLYRTLANMFGKKLGLKVLETEFYELGPEPATEFLLLDKTLFEEVKKTPVIKFSKKSKPVQTVLDVIDVKYKVQQAKVKFSKNVDLSETLNDMIEAKKGIPSEQTFDQLAIGIGKRKGKRKLFLPYSAEDFLGLIYPLISKGKLGDAQLEFFNQALFKPFARAMNNVSKDRVQITKDFKALKKQLKNVPKNLRKEVMPGLTYENAVRIYIWDKQGIEVEGVSDKTIENVWEVMQENPELQAFADQLININKGDGYQYPGGTWLNGTITTDLYAGLNGVKRAKYLEEWTRNKNLMFTKENMLKLEAAYGPRYVESLKDILRRMETGVNRPEKSNRIEDMVMNWVNGSVGVTMFLNTRSAILQTISTINFVNWKDNNPLAAGKAFLNFPQFGKDFVYLIKSDFMKDRRSGLKINVSESEVADAARKGGYKGVINLLLQAGFSFTKAGDAFAIAFGGATFYRNRIKTYEKQGMSTKEAEAAAFEDFREITEESQQSARPDKISAQQSNRYGRVILAFANTPMQYNRIIKRAVQDIANGRGDLKSNISKIAYYGLVQNLIFNTLQTALFALLFDDEEDEDKAAKTKQEKMIKVTNGMADSILRGMGYAGAAISVIKNVALKLKKESEKEGLTNFGDVGVDILGIAPPIQAKIRRFQQAGKTIDYNKKEIEEMGYKFSLDNPSYQAAAAVISGATNIPLDRLMLKIQNIDGALNSEYDLWQRLALGAGWNKWNLGIGQKEKEEKKAAKKAGDGIVTYEEVKYEKVKYD